MTPNLSLTDRSTWVAILTLVAAGLSDVFHRSFAAYVPAAATVAAALVVAAVLFSKHHLTAALSAVAGAVAPAQSQLPTDAPQEVKDLAAALLAAAPVLTASQPLQTPPAASGPSPASVAPSAPLGA